MAEEHSLSINKWGGIAVPIVLTLIIAGASWYLWDWLVASSTAGTTKSSTGGSTNSDTLRNIALTIGGVWAVYAVLLAAQRVKIMQDTQISESIGRAAEQLSNKEAMSIRILAILSLEKIAINADTQICQDIMQVLSAYAKEKITTEEGKPIITDDIREILTVLSAMQEKKKGNLNLDLSKINLSYVDLAGIVLSGNNLSNADLSGADLSDANLSDTNLSGVNLLDADLSDADLSGANLSGANLSDANLSGADLLDADLQNVQGLDTAEDLETVKNPPPAILTEIEKRNKSKP